MIKDNNFESVSKIFTTDDKTEMIQAFKELIIKRFENDLDQFDQYLFYSSKIEGWIDEMFQEVIDEVRVEFKQKLREQMLKLFEDNSVENILALSKNVK
jgi:hypothetical protein